MAIEKPEYRVLAEVGGVEFREYDPYWIAECDFPNQQSLREASSRGFQYLFNYISGQNESAQKIAMTAPVQQMPSGSGWAISFVVPKSFYSGAIPVPANPAVRVRKVEGGLVAALRYRGNWDSVEFAEQAKELAAMLVKLKVAVTGPFTSAVYNPPITPAFLRRNEVLVSVANLPGSTR